MGYLGHVFPIPVGHGGLVGTRDQVDIDPSQLIVARNVSFEGRTLSKEGGAAKYNTTVISGAPSVIGGWDWWPSDGTQRMVVVLSDGSIKKDSGPGTFGTTLVSGLTVTEVMPVFVEGGKEGAALNRKLFIFTGKNAVQVLAADGATTSNLLTPPADWTGANQPSWGLIHEGRLMGGGNLNDPHRLYYSTSTSHEDFTGAGSGSFAIYPGEGERIVGAMSFKGLVILWKYPVGIYVLDTTDPNIANWKVKRLSRAVGGVSPQGAIEVDNDVIFMDATANFHLLSAVQEFGDAAASNITIKNDIYTFIQRNFNLSRLRFAHGVYYSAKREAHFAVSGSSASMNNVRFVIDFNRHDTIRFRYSDRDVCESMWLRKDATTIQRLVSGDDEGFVWLLDQAAKSKDGLGYAGAWQTPYMDFNWVDPRFGTVRKIGQFLECVAEPKGNWNLTVTVLWDGEAVQNVTFNMGVTGAVLGSFVLGTDMLGGDQILNRKRRIVGSGRRLSIAGVNSGPGEDFSVGHFYLHCLISDERPGRDDE